MRIGRLSMVMVLLLACGCASDNSFLGYVKGLRGKTVKENVRNLTHEDPDVRRQAVVALGERRNPDVLKIVCAVLDGDKDAMVRASAAEALGKIGDPGAIPSLVKALSDEYYPVRWDALKALGELKAESALPDIERLARTDRQSDCRQAAVIALGKIGGKEVIGTLIDALGDKDESVGYFASQNLARLTGKNFGIQPTKWAQWWDENRDKPLPPPAGATTPTSWWARWRGGSKAAPTATAPAPAKPEAKTEPAPAPPAPSKPEAKPAPPASGQKAPAPKSGNWFTNLFKKKEPAPPEAKNPETPPAPEGKEKK